MEDTEDQTPECIPPVSRTVLWVAAVHCYCVVVLGTVGNGVALWCVGTCVQSRLPAKVLLFSVFVPALLVCVAMQPVIGETLIALLTCDKNRVSRTVYLIMGTTYFILAQIQLASIAALAVVRAVSVWTPHNPTLGLRGTVVLVTAICLYSILTGLGVMGLLMKAELDSQKTVVGIVFFVRAVVPSLITAAAYIAMIVAVQRNKRRLDAVNMRSGQPFTMDQATRAMLAVFISTLVFGLPHSIFSLITNQSHYMSITFHVLYSTHFVVDPLVLICFNSSFRKRIFSLS